MNNPSLRTVAALSKAIRVLLDDGNIAPAVGPIEDPDEARALILEMLEASSALSWSVRKIFDKVGVSYCESD